MTVATAKATAIASILGAAIDCLPFSTGESRDLLSQLITGNSNAIASAAEQRRSALEESCRKARFLAGTFRRKV